MLNRDMRGSVIMLRRDMLNNVITVRAIRKAIMFNNVRAFIVVTET
jgi:hypothetical protein